MKVINDLAREPRDARAVMQIREVMSTEATACLPEESCAVAGELMRHAKSGVLPVVDTRKTGRVLGVVTARDMLLRLLRLDRAASQVAVKACMNKTIETVSSTASLDEAVQAMKSAGESRLPVVDDGKLVGTISLQDMEAAARKQRVYVGQHVTDQHVIEILDAIARRV